MITVTPAEDFVATMKAGGTPSAASVTYTINNESGETLTWSVGISTPIEQLVEANGETSGELPDREMLPIEFVWNGEVAAGLSAGNYAVELAFFDKGDAFATRMMTLQVKPIGGRGRYRGRGRGSSSHW